MNKAIALGLMIPALSWANELPPPKPIKPVEAHAPAAEVKAPSKHAAPQKMAEPIKIGKPAAASTEHAVVAEEVKPAVNAEAKPVKEPVSRYISPVFSVKSAEHRPVVRSKAPSRSSNKMYTKKTANYAMQPGLVRVLPSSKIPEFAVLPPTKARSKTAMVEPSMQSNVTWGEEEKSREVAKPVAAIPVVGRQMASPNYYLEANPELRWQYYSYP